MTSSLAERYEAHHRLERRGRLALAGGIVATIGVWLTAPIGVVLLVAGNAAGWALVAVGVLLAAAAVLGFGTRVRIVRATAAQTVHGKANPHFDEPDAPLARPGVPLGLVGPGLTP